MKHGGLTSRLVMGASRFSVFLLIILLSGCSFHSNQWNILSSLWQREEGPQKNWQVRWSNRVFDVFAINAGQEVIFADGDGFILRFDGWQVTRVEGFLPAQDTLTISKEEPSGGEGILLQYAGTSSRFGAQQCTNWLLSDRVGGEDPEQYVVYEQDCATSRGSVTHSIALNGEGQLMALSFTLHPAYDPASVRFTGY